jgi:DNA polymerase III gamma/tau subunit
MELHLKHRPQTLDQVIGQAQTVATIRNMLANGTVPRVLLFQGPRGTGKTTLARITAAALGCSGMDLAIMNSGSFRGIDTIRDVMGKMYMAASGPCRVWIFEEVHQWTKDAQEAALLMTEEPPTNVYFFLCTTNPEKLRPALQDRCTKMDVKELSYAELEQLANRVCKKERLEILPKLIDQASVAARGSGRGLLVRLAALGSLTGPQQSEAETAADAEDEEAITLCRMLMKGKQCSWKGVAELLKKLKGDPESTRLAVMGYARAVLLTGKPDIQAFIILQNFEEPFWNSGAPGLCRACYQAIMVD